MLNSQLQPSSQHQQLLASDNGNAPGYFIFDDLTTALQERSNNDQSTIAHQPLLQQHQQKYLFGELSQKINKKKMKNQKSACISIICAYLLLYNHRSRSRFISSLDFLYKKKVK